MYCLEVDRLWLASENCQLPVTKVSSQTKTCVQTVAPLFPSQFWQLVAHQVKVGVAIDTRKTFTTDQRNSPAKKSTFILARWQHQVWRVKWIALISGRIAFTFPTSFVLGAIFFCNPTSTMETGCNLRRKKRNFGIDGFSDNLEVPSRAAFRFVVVQSERLFFLLCFCFNGVARRRRTPPPPFQG